jgi:hypothetical protein
MAPICGLLRYPPSECCILGCATAGSGCRAELSIPCGRLGSAPLNEVEDDTEWILHVNAVGCVGPDRHQCTAGCLELSKRRCAIRHVE